MAIVENNDLSITTEEVERRASELDTEKDEFYRNLEELKKSIEANVNNPQVWQSESSQKFSQSWDEFASLYPGFVAKLEEASRNVRTSAQIAASADQPN